METTVKSLRQQGYKVRVLHHRDYAYVHPPEKFDRVKKLMQKGGKTEVQILSPDGKSSEGIALCSPKDNYNKRLGVKIALNRAINNLRGESHSSTTKTKNNTQDVFVKLFVKPLISNTEAKEFTELYEFFTEEAKKIINGEVDKLFKR